jgi:cyclophilin family peptidyl-prolyl cis-trans isomerase
MQQPIPAHHAPSEELSEGELPEVLKKAADEDLAAIKKAKAKRGKAVAQVGAKADEKIKPPTDLDVAAPKKKTQEQVAAKTHKRAETRTTADSTANEMDTAKTTKQTEASTDTVSDATTIQEVQQLTQQKNIAMHKEQEYLKKYDAAQNEARDAQAKAIEDMKKAKSASSQAAKWHNAATEEHAFFEKASAAERAALEKGQAIERVRAAKAALNAKASVKESASAELASVAKNAELSAKAALASEGSKGLSFIQRASGHSLSALADSTDVVMNVVLKPGAAPSAVRVKLHPEWAPVGVAQFQKLVSSHAIDEAAFFRVVPGFIVQFGLPAHPQPEMASLQDDPVKVSNQRGTVVFATAGPNTRTNQLFINLGNNANLDGQGFSPIGEVVDGMETVDAINPEYGEKPDQSSIKAQGNAYLDPLFPNLSKIQSASMQ